MITFMDKKDNKKESDNFLDSQLWHACAGAMVQMPSVKSTVVYFVQGHIEHANTSTVDFRNFPGIPPYHLCRVDAINYLADGDTDEVYAKIRLAPISITNKQLDLDLDLGDANIDEAGGPNHKYSVLPAENKPASFAKTLTQSDANNGGGFSVPRYCAETIFPRLDYSADPPVQNLVARDVHGHAWKFRHIYRGTPRRHLLTTGWSAFVNAKKLVAGDSVVFLRADNGDLRVGIRRAKRGIGGGQEASSGWNPSPGFMPGSGGFLSLLREGAENRMGGGRSGNCTAGFNTVGGGNNNTVLTKGKVRIESVVEAVSLAAKGQAFEVEFYPRAGTPEFVVKAGQVKAALQTRWCAGMRFKMPFETEDSSRISWFMGTISCVQVPDPMSWPASPWKLLQVTWDEPDLLQNVKRVSPWLVELVSNMPTIHLSPFSLPSRKKLRLSQHPDSLPMETRLPIPTSPWGGPTITNSLGYCLLENNSPAGMQGARHGQFGHITSLPEHPQQIMGKVNPGGLLPTRLPVAALNHPTALIHQAAATPAPVSLQMKSSTKEDVSCLLTMATSSSSTRSSQTPNKSSELKKVSNPFVLFGKTIFPEEQMSSSSSGGTVSPGENGNNVESSSSNNNKMHNGSNGSRSTLIKETTLLRKQISGRPEQYVDQEETGPCKVFMESDEVGRTLDLSLFKSYDEMSKTLASMFEVDREMAINHVLYRDSTGLAKQIGDEPFSKFAKRAKRLTIVMDAGSDNQQN